MVPGSHRPVCREEQPAQGDHGPERGEGDRRLRRRGAEGGGHVGLRPVPVHRLAHAVQDRERGEEPEPRRDAATTRLRFDGVAPVDDEGQPDRGDEEEDQEHRRQQREPPPEAQADEDRHEDWSQGGAGAQQCVERQHRTLRPVGPERRDVGVEDRNRQTETRAQEAGRQQQQREGHRLGLYASRRDEDEHGDDVRREAEEQDLLAAETTGDTGAEERRDDGGGHLRQEHGPVLRAGQVVPRRVGEDRARRREGHQDDALDQPGEVDHAELGRRRHRGSPGRTGQPSRESRWSPTRRALAIAVRAGFTAPMLGKKLVSTT